MSDSLGVSLSLGLIKTFVCIYDILTFPFYLLTQRPWKTRSSDNLIIAKQVNCNDIYSEWKRLGSVPDHPVFHVPTVSAFFSEAIEIYGDKKCMGYREVLAEEDEIQPGGKVFRKLILGDFIWFTYNQINIRIENVAKGFALVGVKPNDNVMIFAETRLEWYLSCQALFRLGASVSTLYPTLGTEAIIHGINETEVTHLITTYDLLPKINAICKKLTHLSNIIYIEGFKKPYLEGFENLTLTPFSKIEQLGELTKENIIFEARKPEDIAVIMYTSGSTGVPKGVIINHRNILATIKGFYAIAHTLERDKNYLAFLPLAHVLELAAECFFLSIGIAIGYSSPQTMTDKSTAIKNGQKGDASLIKPMVMASVPLVLDRIKKAILEQVEAKGPFVKNLFKFLIDYKIFWTKKGFNTPILNKLVCHKIKALLGGNIKYIVCGSAPLAPDTHEFIRACLDVILITGYGLTETTAGATLMDFCDNSVSRAGAPLYGLSIKLCDWDEGNYHVTDKPYPRGEIIIGGDCVTDGYFKNEELTQKFFKVENGKRWFFTGDIGEIHPDGVIKLIDRRKDLVKLQYGEYISLGKIETELKTCPIIDNICVYGDSFHTYVIALIVPNEKVLSSLARQLNKEHLTHRERCRDAVIIDYVKKLIVEKAIQADFNKTEIPAKIMLVDEEWTPDSGLVTAAMKIRRKLIKDRYLNDINKMYNICNVNGVQSA